MEGGACIPLRVHTIVISVQHSEDITVEEMRKQLKEKVIKVRGGEIKSLVFKQMWGESSMGVLQVNN